MMKEKDDGEESDDNDSDDGPVDSDEEEKKGQEGNEQKAGNNKKLRDKVSRLAQSLKRVLERFKRDNETEEEK